MNQRSASGQWSERGSTLVEFALVAIVLFMMLFGIIDFGRALYTYHFVANAAREGARFAIVRGQTCTVTGGGITPCPADSTDVQTYLRNSATGIGLDSTQLAVSATWPGVTGNGITCSTINNPGCIVQVQVTYPFKFSFPLLPTGTYNMTSSSQMVISQ